MSQYYGETPLKTNFIQINTMVGPKPTRLWHRLCRKHFWWLINETIYARCPPKRKPRKYYEVPDPCPEPVCPPHEHFNRKDFLIIVGIVLASTCGLNYAFGHFDPSKYEPYFSSYVCESTIVKEKKKKVPCDQREPEEIPPCVCDEPEEPPQKKNKKGK